MCFACIFGDNNVSRMLLVLIHHFNGSIKPHIHIMVAIFLFSLFLLLLLLLLVFVVFSFSQV